MRENIPERSPQNYAVEDERLRLKAEKWLKNRLSSKWIMAKREVNRYRSQDSYNAHHERALAVLLAVHERVADLYAEVYLTIASDEGDVIGSAPEVSDEP